MYEVVRMLNQMFQYVGLRSNQSYWGVVYDSRTKQPIDPAIVKLVHVNSGRVVETCVTDMNGRYGFLSHPGRYKILVQRTNYSFPSTESVSDNDGVYDNIYHGEFFEMQKDTDVIALNIPLDPTASDWNQHAKLSRVNSSPYVNYVTRSIVKILFWFVLLYSAIQEYIGAGIMYRNILIAYAVLFFVAALLPRLRLWGVVVRRKGHVPMAGVALELRHESLNTVVVGSAITSAEGRYFLRAAAGKYLLVIKDNASTGGGKEIYRALTKVGKDGVLNKTIKV